MIILYFIKVKKTFKAVTISKISSFPSTSDSKSSIILDPFQRIH